MPDGIIESPELDESLDFYNEAFWELSTERYIGMDFGQIQHSSIVEYARECDLDQELTFIFCTVIRQMDNFYLDFFRKKKEAERKKKPKKDKSDA